ncbi:MAG: hypothetical protein KF900_07540 [Bacteroidetes bacterium]|nr:hypothetical protein [Bacteroidota bacterium]
MENLELKKIKSRIDFFCRNKINAFSPTISPAPKSFERGEIESLYEGIRFFMRYGETEFVIQQKYMGSYCDIYLHRNLSDTYFVSRNGFKINHINLEEAKLSLQDLHKRLDWENVSLYIIQSELMPWKVLGGGLIDAEFYGYLNAHQNHLRFLQTSPLYEKIEQVKSSEAYKNFVADKETLDEKALKQKYPSHIVRQYESLYNFDVKDLAQYKQATEIYQTQIDHFSREGNINFKPFNILKIVYENGTEDIVNDNLSYTKVNADEFLHLKIENEEALKTQFSEIEKWYKNLAENLEEGVVIKPRRAFIKNMPPALKVRNPNYLVMIYGVDFARNFDYYIQRRKIDSKIRCSVNDWAINYEMLKVPYKSINEENYKLKNLVFDRIMGEEVENKLDSRL